MSGMCYINGISFPVSSSKQCFELTKDTPKPAPKKEVSIWDNVQASGSLGEPVGVTACSAKTEKKPHPTSSPGQLKALRKMFPNLDEIPFGKDFHFKVLEKNWKFREKVRINAAMQTIKKVDKTLGLIDSDLPEAKGIMDEIQGLAFDVASHFSFQTANWQKLDGAGKCVNMYYFSRGESTGYLKKAEQYILAALGNADTNQIHDLLNFTLGPSIFPVESYFELKLTLFQVLSIAQKPKEALALADEIEAELKSPRVLVAQRSGSVSAGGYLNRLDLLRAFAGIYNPEMSPADGLVYAMKAHAWAKAQHEKPGIYLAAWEMSKKDLKYDTLLSLIIMGRLYPKLNQFDAARKVFQQAFAAPEAVRRDGGFLDIGLQSFYGLANIALADSESLEEAAEKFDEWVDWNKIAKASHVDFRESMGMIIKKETLTAWLSGLFGFEVEDIFPPEHDPEDIISEIDISNYKTPLERLKLAMKLIDHVDIPYDQKEEVMTFYNLLADLEEVE